ncbi:MAG: DUF4160 domain-containing protein [Terriglobales bacterium]|jgi:hypothetical protein
MLSWFPSDWAVFDSLFIRNDHPPRHVHGSAGETEVIVDLRVDGTVGLADRDDAIRPANAKRSDVRKILEAAADNFERLAEMWEAIYGRA